jgi:hypothetical protein
MKINRNFLRLKGKRLLVFGERILRCTHKNYLFADAHLLIQTLQKAHISLDLVLKPTIPRPRNQAQLIRSAEGPLHEALLQLADWIDAHLTLKSDIQSSGFGYISNHNTLAKSGHNSVKKS